MRLTDRRGESAPSRHASRAAVRASAVTTPMTAVASSAWPTTESAPVNWAAMVGARAANGPMTAKLANPRMAAQTKNAQRGPWGHPRCMCLQFVYTGSMAAETTTVRVRRPDSERLQSLAKARQTAVVDVVHAAIDALERQEFLRGLNGDYQRLRNDPELWEQYLAERHEWDALA